MGQTFPLELDAHYSLSIYLGIYPRTVIYPRVAASYRGYKSRITVRYPILATPRKANPCINVYTKVKQATIFQLCKKILKFSGYALTKIQHSVIFEQSPNANKTKKRSAIISFSQYAIHKDIIGP